MKTEVILSALEAKHPGEKEYLQAVKEVLLSIEEVYNQHPEFEKAKIIERLVEPERIFTFRVPWVDDKGEMELSATVLDIKESLVVYGKVTGWCAPVLSLTVTMPVFLSTEKFLSDAGISSPSTALVEV